MKSIKCQIRTIVMVVGTISVKEGIWRKYLKTKFWQKRLTAKASSVLFVSDFGRSKKTPLSKQNWATLHLSVFVLQCLDQKYCSQGMGRAGPISRHLLLRDLTPYDYFLKRYLKNIEYRVPCNRYLELSLKIMLSLASINEDTLTLYEIRINCLIFELRERHGHF